MNDNIKERFNSSVNYIIEFFERTSIATGIPTQLSCAELIGVYQAAANLVVAETIERADRRHG